MKSKVVETLHSYDRVLFLGPFPPPLGGVSVHIYRLSKLLDNAHVFNTAEAKGIKALKYLSLCYGLLTSRYRVVHVHHFNKNLIALLYGLKVVKGFTLIATVHNPRLFETAGSREYRLLSRFVRKIDTLIAVSDEIIQDFYNRGIDLPTDIVIEPAFIPPPAEDEAEILRTYPASLLEFISDHTPLLSANAYALVFHGDIELYGLNTCIELTRTLKSTFPRIGFLFALADDTKNKSYLNAMRKQITELGLDNNFYIMSGQTELWPLLKRMDLMVRPTSSDGDAVSIREALHFKTAVVASDVTHRPPPTQLYRFGDSADLCAKVRDIIEVASD